MKLGLYHHFKNKSYRAIMLGTLDSSVLGNRIPAVIYIPLYEPREITICTQERFEEFVNVEGEVRNRFKYISS